MKLAVVGTRTFNNYELLKFELDKIEDITLIISGGAKGADSLAEKYASENNIPTKIFIADWHKYGLSAGPIRNKLIIKACDKCIAFWNGKSSGTSHDIFLCKELNKPITIVNY